MATRKKLYYSEVEIEKNLVTNGKQWMLLENWEEYIGYYHSYSSTREVYTEKEWHPKKSKVLVPFKEKPKSYFNYVDLVSYTRDSGEKRRFSGPSRYDNFTSPVYVARIPTPKELQEGIMERYFLIKRNEKSIRTPIEIDQIQAKTYNDSDSGINQFLYELVKMPWKIQGPEFDVFDGSILKIPGVVDTNRRIVDRFSKNFPILRKVLTNFREFSIYNVNNAY